MGIIAVVMAPEDELVGPDYVSDEVAACSLAAKIERFWAANGHPEVRCWVEFSNGGWCQRSSLDLRGSPPPATAVTTPPGDELVEDEMIEDHEVTAPIAAVAAPLPRAGRCLWPLADALDSPIR